MHEVMWRARHFVVKKHKVYNWCQPVKVTAVNMSMWSMLPFSSSPIYVVLSLIFESRYQWWFSFPASLHQHPILQQKYALKSLCLFVCLSLFICLSLPPSIYVCLSVCFCFYASPLYVSFYLFSPSECVSLLLDSHTHRNSGI